MNIKYLTEHALLTILAGALVLSISASAALAARNPGNRYGCIAKSGKTFFTDGINVIREHPCDVDPAGVARLIKDRGVDKRTDQVNSDYLWNQEYYTNDGALTDIRKMIEPSPEPAPAPAPVAVVIATPAYTEPVSTPTLVAELPPPPPEDLIMPLSTSAPLTPYDDTRDLAAETFRRARGIPVAGIGIEGTMPVLSLGVRNKNWIGTFFGGLGSADHDPQKTFAQTAANFAGDYTQTADSYKFESNIRRVGLEATRKEASGWSFSGGFRYDRITETYNELRTVRTLNSGIETGLATSTKSGSEKLDLFYTSLGTGYKISSVVNVNVRLLIPLNSEKSSFGNKYDKTVIGMNLTVDLL